MVSHYTPKFKKAWKRVSKILDDQGEAAGKQAFRDEMLKIGHEERVRNLYRVKDKLSSKAIFFVPNGPQEEYLATKSGRDIILKIRQVGFTTMSGVRGLDLALWEENMSTGIMAHLQGVVTTIFEDLVKFSYTWFKKDWGHLYSPTERSDSKTALVFADDGQGRTLNSSMRVLYDFRSKTVNFLHVSEAAFIENDRLLGSLQSVPANGEVILESTPNGRGAEFYRQWQNWRSMGPLAPYRGFFVPWFKFYPEEPERWVLPEGAALTPYERSLLDAYDGVIHEYHIAWRRWCIEANCLGDSEKFENEYPSNDIDCFFTGDALVFPSSTLKAQSTKTRPPSKLGFLLSEGSQKVDLHTDPKGVVAIWEEPDPSCSYAIGADPSGGVGKDLGAAYVINQSNGKLVARLWGQIEPADFALELIKLATYYNKAWICVEANNHGHTVIHVLSTKGYKNLYKRKTIDELTSKPTTKVGFLTTNDSKIMLTEKFKAACKGKLTIFDNDLINEMSTFTQVSSKTGRSVRREASPGCHDDLVMAAAFAEEMNSSRPMGDRQNEVLAATPDESTYPWNSTDSDTGFAA